MLSTVLNICFHQQTPLHIAAKKGYVKTVESLVREGADRKGADINIKDKNGVSK